MKKASKVRFTGGKAVCAAVFAVFVFIILFSPKYYGRFLNKDSYRDWMSYKAEPSVGVIEIWHVAGFKPYLGSLGSWLESKAEKYSSRYINVYFSIKTYSPDDARVQLQLGRRPDNQLLRRIHFSIRTPELYA